MRCNTEQLPPKTYQLAIVLLCGGNCVAGQQISNGATNDGLKRVNMNSNVIGSEKRYIVAHKMIFLYKRCCSKTP